MVVFVVKVILSSLLLITFGLVLRFRPQLDTFFADKGANWFVLMWLCLRLLPFLILYIFLDFKATSDLIGFYNGAIAARSGLLPYRDFVTVYAPFYAYITALPTLFWDDARSIIVLMIIIEGGILWATSYWYRLSLTTVLLYLLLPTTLIFSVIGGQEDIWMWGFALLTIPLLQQQRLVIVGMVLGLSLIVTKALFILFVPLFFFWVDRKERLLLGMLCVGTPVLIWLFITGKWSFLMPLQLTQDPLAPNMRSVLHPFLGNWMDLIPIRGYNYAALVEITVISALFTLRWKKAQLTYPLMLARGWVLVYVLIMLLIPSAYAVYAFGFMLPLVAGGLVGWQQGRSLIVVLVFNLFAAIQPTVWWGLGQHTYQLTDLTHLPFLFDYLLQLGIVGSLIYFIVSLWPTVTTASSQTSNVSVSA